MTARLAAKQVAHGNFLTGRAQRCRAQRYFRRTGVPSRSAGSTMTTSFAFPTRSVRLCPAHLACGLPAPAASADVTRGETTGVVDAALNAEGQSRRVLAAMPYFLSLAAGAPRGTRRRGLNHGEAWPGTWIRRQGSAGLGRAALTRPFQSGTPKVPPNALR